MTKISVNQALELLRQIHRQRSVPAPPPGFDAAIMADIRAMATENDILDMMLPRLSMAAMVMATLALVYGMTMLDAIPSALAGMYGPAVAFGF